VLRITLIMRSARLCKATTPKWQFGVRFDGVGLRIIPGQTGRRCRCRATLRSILLSVGTIGVGRRFLPCFVFPPELMNVVSARPHMTDHFYTFHKSPEELRRLGARGGRACGRNQRARRALVATPPKAVPPPATCPTTTAESIALLDARFPWLRGAEKRRP
jgi:hypothetical protein